MIGGQSIILLTLTNTITFKIGTSGTETIALKSALPKITHSVLIDGTTEPGYGTTPLIVLNGTNASTTADPDPVGLELQADNSTLKGLVIDDFLNGGVKLDTASGTTAGADFADAITDDYIGVTAAGNVAAPNDSFPVQLTDGAYDNSITGDVISGNNSVTGAGVHLNDDSHNNVVAGDKIGTDATGTVALPNAGSGVIIDLGSYDNTIGGTTAAAANVISANKYDGVHIESGPGNVVEGNFIGTDLTGTHALGNGEDGVDIDSAATGNIIGGTVGGARNIISANVWQGIDLNTAVRNVVLGNYVGTDYTGSKPLGNKLDGVIIQESASGNTVGGTTSTAGNTISYNSGNGVALSGAGAGNLVEYDVINSNAEDGVYLDDSPNTPVIDCTIDANVGWGIWEDGSTGYKITGNVLMNNGHNNKIYEG